MLTSTKVLLLPKPNHTQDPPYEFGAVCKRSTSFNEGNFAMEYNRDYSYLTKCIWQ